MRVNKLRKRQDKLQNMDTAVQHILQLTETRRTSSQPVPISYGVVPMSTVTDNKGSHFLVGGQAKRKGASWEMLTTHYNSS